MFSFSGVTERGGEKRIRREAGQEEKIEGEERVKGEKVRKEAKRKELSEAQTSGKVSFLVPEPRIYLVFLKSNSRNSSL